MTLPPRAATSSGQASERFRSFQVLLIFTHHKMRSLSRLIQPGHAPHIHLKHVTRLHTPTRRIEREWTRTFHASTSFRAIDLAYDLHDNGGKATGAPVLVLHGLFGSKKNNRSISKSVAISSAHCASPTRRNNQAFIPTLAKNPPTEP